jgi:hypothetical protein
MVQVARMPFSLILARHFFPRIAAGRERQEQACSATVCLGCLLAAKLCGFVRICPGEPNRAAKVARF